MRHWDGVCDQYYNPQASIPGPVVSGFCIMLVFHISHGTLSLSLEERIKTRFPKCGDYIYLENKFLALTAAE